MGIFDLRTHMIDLNELKRLQIKFMIVMMTMYCLSYAIWVSSINLFQHYVTDHGLASAVYYDRTIFSIRIMILVIGLNLLAKFQNQNYQRILMLILVIATLLLPVSLKTYPLLAGFNDTITELGKAWFQLYVPPAFRATLAGLLTSFTGLIKIRSTTATQYWEQAIIHKYILASILTILLFFFWKFTLKLQKIEQEHHPSVTKHAPDNIVKLLRKNPYIFITCFVFGFNNGIFYYTFLLGAAALPDKAPEVYQYIMYAGSILGPVVIGRFADKFGIALISMYVIALITFCKFLNFSLAFTEITTSHYFYIVAFIEAAFAASLSSLNVSIVGERLRNRGIFRSFAISTIIYSLGALLYGRVYLKFSDSFVSGQLVIGVINIFFFILLCFFYKRSPRVRAN